MASADTGKPIKRFWKLMALERKEVAGIYFFAVLNGVIYLSLPLGVQSIINQLFGGIMSTSLIVLIGVVVLGVFGSGWLTILQMKVNERIQRRIFTRFSLQFAYKIPRLELAAIDNYYLPELVNRFFDTASLQKGLSKVLLEFPSATIQVLFGLILLSFYHPIFIVFGMMMVALIILILRLTYPRGIATSLEESNYKYEVGFWLEEMARIIKSLKFMGINDFPVDRADNLVSGYLDARRDHFSVLKIQFWAFVLFKVVITAALLIVGATLVIQQQINIGQFIASEIIIIMLLNSVEKIIGSLDVVYDMLTSLEKVSKVIDKPDEMNPGKHGVDMATRKGLTIQADALSMRYGNEAKLVLEDINFEIKSGEKVCVLGTQGSGKSTLLRLLTGTYPDFEGNLLFNSFPIGSYDLKLLRTHIGVYLGHPDLFSGTLYDNLCLGKPDITTANIHEVSQLTGLLPYIQSLKNGLQTHIDSIGKKLPRSTVTKILLTRALLREPLLLLLEDCWSGLEKIEEAKLINTLTSKSLTITVIGVTNNESFAAKCDKVILMDEGKIVAVGSFDSVRTTAVYQNIFKQLSL